MSDENGQVKAIENKKYENRKIKEWRNNYQRMSSEYIRIREYVRMIE